MIGKINRVRAAKRCMREMDKLVRLHAPQASERYRMLKMAKDHQGWAPRDVGDCQVEPRPAANDGLRG